MFNKQSLPGRILSQLLVLAALVAFAIPLVLIVATSLDGGGLGNYLDVLARTPFLDFIRNSLVVATVTVVATTALALLAAFSFETLRPRGTRVLKLVLLSGLALPVVAVVVPLYALMQQLELFNTFWAVILPLTAVSIPFGILLMGNYIGGLPPEIYEAARMDGAGPTRYLVSVLLPLCRPIIAVVALFTFLAAWNEYVLPLIFLQSTGLQVATQIPNYFQGDRLIELPKVFAANILISLPLVALYLLLQRQFRQGLSGGSVK
ncbi:carbohydrate ABC transporter permease [Herbiconiux sp. A18JL235]|uniref:Carbohydrate ABC transporter permease n=1 Tax=Herbiconiux sp. A18JL235 TaxID=3152363 RepID=A0AB39BDC1_9MICO